MSFESKFSNVCRACLVENVGMKSVFSTEKLKDEEIPINDVLMSFASVQILKNDGLPDQVCLNCVEEINRAFLFKKLCQESDNTLRSYTQTYLPQKTEEEKTFKTEQTQEDDNEDDEVVFEDFYQEHDSSGIDDYEDNDEDDDVAYKKKIKIRKQKCKSLNSDLKNQEYICKLCQNPCSDLTTYNQHMIETHGLIYKSDMCQQECKSESILSGHASTRPTENDENFETETKSIKRKTGIIRKRNLPRTCDICNKTFRFHSNLERHKLIHTGEKPYLCNVCGKGFAQLSYLKIHSFIHTGEKPYKCKMCEKGFAAPGTLMTHIRTHTGERPHVCKICGKDFPQSGYLSAHIRTHTGEKPVECKVCHRRFNQSGRLIIHMRIHSGEKPYNCKECGRSFAVKGTLKKHIRTHTGERPYICSVCGQAFAQSGTLATHMKVHKPKSEAFG